MEIKGLTKVFDNKTIFNDLTISIPDSKITYIIGESGCGKTTLLRLICGLDKIYSGEITKISNKISCVFQEPRLFPTLNLRENINIVHKGSEYSDTEILKIVELENDADLFPSELSGGMKMRASIARALYYNGDIFVMDEPFSALDEDLKSRIIPKIFEILKGKTVLIVSHDTAEVERYADNIVKLK